MDKVLYIVSEEHKGDRLDKFISVVDEQFSRTQAQLLIKEGNVHVNGRSVKTNYKCQVGDEVAIDVPEPVELDIKAEEMDLDVYYEDADVLVVNKPKGMVVHPAPGHTSGTLVNGLMAHCKDLSGINGVMRPGIVHRIDKDTSGNKKVPRACAWRHFT